jgi:hypothetical protein
VSLKIQFVGSQVVKKRATRLEPTTSAYSMSDEQV